MLHTKVINIKYNHQCLRAVRVGPVDDVEGVAFAEEVLLVQRLGR